MDTDLHRRPSYSDLIDRALSRFPHHIAFKSAGETWTYEHTRSRVSQFAQALSDLGVRRGDGIVVLSGNRPEVFCVMAAALQVGARYAPLHPLGGLEDHVFICEDSQAKAFVYDPRHHEDAAVQIATAARSLAHVLALGPGKVGHDLNAMAREREPRPLNTDAREEDLALLMYTGGTTGRPKGVMQPHRSIVTNVMLALAEWQLGEAPIFLGCAPLSHGLLHMVLPVLLRGGTMVLHDGFEPDAVLDAIEREGITSSFWVPTMIYALLDHPRTRGANLSSLRTIIYGAAPISPERLREALGVFGPVFLQVYAQTEAPNTAVVLRREQHDPNHPTRLASAGKPLVGVDLRILDSEGHEVPDGTVGEVCIRGPIVMDGYWNRPEQTAETLRGGWLHTGDLARFDEEGYLFIVDRSKEMIVSGGFNVFPREIEDVLSGHAAVSAAAVIGVPDAHWGEAVKAVVVRRQGARVTAGELVDLVRERKGSVYAPKSVDFVDALPLTPVGKVDKPTLRSQYWAAEERRVH